MALQLKPSVPSTHNDIFYPDSDGKPMAESDLHRDIMVYIIHLLQRFFAGQQVYISGNLFVYYEKGSPRKSISPDCFVVFDIDPQKRRSYKIWEEGKGPDVVFEVSSKSTANADVTTKFGRYAKMGVKEYFIYDPTSDYLNPPLIGYELVEGEGYVPMQPLRGEVALGDLRFVPGESEPPEFESTLLGLRITLNDENELVLYEAQTGKQLLSAEEENEALHAEIVRLKAQVDQRN